MPIKSILISGGLINMNQIMYLGFSNFENIVSENQVQCPLQHSSVDLEKCYSCRQLIKISTINDEKIVRSETHHT